MYNNLYSIYYILNLNLSLFPFFQLYILLYNLLYKYNLCVYTLARHTEQHIAYLIEPVIAILKVLLLEAKDLSNQTGPKRVRSLLSRCPFIALKNNVQKEKRERATPLSTGTLGRRPNICIVIYLSRYLKSYYLFHYSFLYYKLKIYII